MGETDAVVRVDGAVEGAGLRYRSAPARRRRILELLSGTGFRSVVDLAGDLGVSDMTIRRDLRMLEREGDVRSVHGGAWLPPDSSPAPAFGVRATVQTEAKRRIAAAAVALVQLDEPVAVDAGTTAYEVACALPPDFVGTVITHSVPVIAHLMGRPWITVVGLGGELLPASQALVGSAGVEAARSLRVRRLFLGAAAVDERGVYVDADAERATKLAMLRMTDQVVLVADHSKFSSSAPVLLCGLDQVHLLITDARPSRSLTLALRHGGTRVVLAP